VMVLVEREALYLILEHPRLVLDQPCASPYLVRCSQPPQHMKAQHYSKP
jgi:hypothetical protein